MPKNAVLGGILSLGLLFGSLVYGQMGMPQQNISGKKHPNLAAAQRLCDQAFEKIQAAQSANEWDMSGHAAKAKELLEQASHELKQAAESANKH